MRTVSFKLVIIGLFIVFAGLLPIIGYGEVTAANRPPATTQMVAADDEPTPSQKAVKDLKPEDFVASYQKALTLAQLQDLFSVRRPRAFAFHRPQDIPKLPPATFRQLLKEIAIQDILYQKASLEGFTPETERDKGAIEEIKDTALGYAVYRREVEEKVEKASEEEAHAYYQEHIKDYTTPFNFHIRHIFVSTYKPYTSKEGDTLESVAEQLSGDKKAIEFILFDETKEPRYVKPEERDEKLFQPLKPGEALLVPMNREEKQKAHEKITMVYDELKKGADFIELAKKYSEADRPGEMVGPIIPGESEKPLLPEILAAVEKTPVGQFSYIIQTKHGYQIVKVEKKSEEKVTPFDSLKDRIVSTLSLNRRAERFKQYVEAVIEEGKVIKTYPEVLTGDQPSSAILAEVKDIKYTLEEFNRDLARLADDLTTPEEKIKLLASHPRLRNAILASEAKRRGLEDSQDYKFFQENRLIAFIAERYLNKLINDKVSWTEEDIKKYYQDHIDLFTVPKKYKVRQITRQIAEDISKLNPEERQNKVEQLKAELAVIKEKIETTEDFVKYAQEISEDKFTRDRGGDVGYVTESYKKGFDGQLLKLQPGQVSEPFEFGSDVYLIMLEDLQEAQVHPLDEVYERAKNGFLATKRKELRQTITDELMKEYNFQLLL